MLLSSVQQERRRARVVRAAACLSPTAHLLFAARRSLRRNVRTLRKSTPVPSACRRNCDPSRRFGQTRATPLHNGARDKAATRYSNRSATKADRVRELAVTRQSRRRGVPSTRDKETRTSDARRRNSASAPTLA